MKKDSSIIDDNCTIACSLPDDAFKKRKAAIASAIISKIIFTEDIENGFEFSFEYSEAMFLELAEFINVERQCCPFINFHLRLNSNSNNIVLSLTGPGGTKDFMQYELGMI